VILRIATPWKYTATFNGYYVPMDPSSRRIELPRGSIEWRRARWYRYTVAMYRYNGPFPLFCDTLQEYNRDPHRFIAPTKRSTATVFRCDASSEPSTATVEEGNDRRGGYSATRNVCFEAVDRARGTGEAP
jgi:hypothetical protein